jgi:hypothetical protein
VSAIAKEEAAADAHTAFFEVLDLTEKFVAIDDDAVADEAELIWVENTGWDEMKLELAEFVDDGMAGVVAR